MVRQNTRLKRTHDIDAVFHVCHHQPKKLLDVGFGNCVIAKYYASQGIEVSGVEVSQKAYERAIEDNTPNLRLYLYDGDHLPFEDSSFDTIIVNDVLEHISYDTIEVLLPEMIRVLKTHGLIFVSVMNRWQLLEPHKLIPFLTWLPQPCWRPVCKKLTGMDYINYWPCTRKRAQNLFTRFNLQYSDMSFIYVENKFLGKNPMGSKTTRRLLGLLLKLGLRRVAYIFALKVTVLIYALKVNKHFF